MNGVFESLVEAGIQLLPDAGSTTHFVFERQGFAALVERKAGGFGSVGTPGLLTAHGLAMLLWRGGEPWFVAKGWEQAASADQVAGLRAFFEDLEAALRPH